MLFGDGVTLVSAVVPKAGSEMPKVVLATRPKKTRSVPKSNELIPATLGTVAPSNIVTLKNSMPEP